MLRVWPPSILRGFHSKYSKKLGVQVARLHFWPEWPATFKGLVERDPHFATLGSVRKQESDILHATGHDGDASGLEHGLPPCLLLRA